MGGRTSFKVIYFLIVLYIFLVAIQLMGHSLKLFGGGFAQGLISTTSNPFVGLLIGIIVTSVIQSSSTTTSLVVGMVAGNVLTLSNAIPIIMGANIGTTVTNTMVSMAHISRKQEFKRAFAGATVHDFFNILAVIILFPVELSFHIIEKTAVWLSEIFIGVGGFKFLSPIKLITEPAINFFSNGLNYPIIMLFVALVLLFFSLVYMVKTMKILIINKVEAFFDTFLFRNDIISFGFGMVLTALVQSSSVTTSLIIPLVGAGVLTVRKIFPYTLGANLGTTVTALLAACASLCPVALTVAFSHLVFNIMGTVLFYPLKAIPIGIAKKLAVIVSRTKTNSILFIVVYFMIIIVPLVLLIWK